MREKIGWKTPTGISIISFIIDEMCDWYQVYVLWMLF